MSMATSAAAKGIMVCHTCGQLAHASPSAHVAWCPRCTAPMHFRKPDSVSRTWALLTAAVIAYVPANVLPVMVTSSLFGAQSDTIMSGVVYLWVTGSWPLALIVFVASVMVPLLKILALAYLNLSVQRRSRWQPGQRTRLYRLVELIGRWSMLDIYVIAILVGLVQLQGLATITAGPAALAFAAVVILTMVAAMSFEPRLIWDPLEEQDA